MQLLLLLSLVFRLYFALTCVILFYFFLFFVEAGAYLPRSYYILYVKISTLLKAFRRGIISSAHCFSFFMRAVKFLITWRFILFILVRASVKNAQRL